VTPLLALDYFFPQALSLPSAGLVDPQAPAMADPVLIETALASDEAKAAILSARLEIPRPMLAAR